MICVTEITANTPRKKEDKGRDRKRMTGSNARLLDYLKER